MKLCYRIWLDQEGKVFGRGPYELLDGVRQTGSLAEAAKRMKMSYNKAYTMIKDIEKRLGYELIESKRGGSDKGGSCVTREAQELMDRYESFVKECGILLEELYDKHFGKKP